MYTLRFKRDDFEAVAGGAKYEVHRRREVRTDDGPAAICNATITVYEKLDSPIGVDFHLHGCDCADEREYTVVFIENMAGKTIDRVGPFTSAIAVMERPQTL
ncbi:MAG: hypothetical protein COA78_25230 [Blastopirellula sp.]|nr:MAG: hypothetical protein COA78_25230 [Blastopirellula sp.]